MPGDLLALACLFASVVCGLTENSRVLASAASARGSSTARRVSIRATVNGLAVTVRANGTLAPASTSVGTAEQFEVHDIGKGVIALRAMANGKFVSARGLEPVRADAEHIGTAQQFRTPGGSAGLVRLRSPVAKGFACATQRGQGVIAITKHCQHRSQLFEFEPLPAAPPSFTITLPTPGSTLTSTAVGFRWDADGDEYWLKVGSVPGGSDIYSSGSLGSAHEHIASGLPLNGQKLYVQVSRRIGTVIDTSGAEYAAIRKGLAVIVDFATVALRIRQERDSGALTMCARSLLRWSNTGIGSAATSSGSNGTSFAFSCRTRPSPMRIRSYWVTFREAVIALVREQVPAADYDVNSDDLIDAAWLIVSSDLEPMPLSIGESQRHQRRAASSRR